MRIEEAKYCREAGFPLTGLNKAMIEVLTTQDNLCSKCESSKTKLCDGNRYFVDRESTSLRIEIAGCYRVSKKEEVSIRERLKLAQMSDDEIDKVLNGSGYEKFKMGDKIKYGSSTYPLTAVGAKPVSVQSINKYHGALVGACEAGYSTAQIIPYKDAQSNRNFKEWQDYFDETDFMLVYRPEELVPQSQGYNHLISLISQRIGAGRPTWTALASFDRIEDALENEHHPLRGLAEVLDALPRLKL